MCDHWSGHVMPCLHGMPALVIGHIRSYVEPSYPPCITSIVFPLLCTALRDRFRSTPCQYRSLCGRTICTAHMPSAPLLQYINDRVRNVGYSHFPTLRLANFARKFIVADAICCGGKGFTAYRWSGHTVTTNIMWRGVKRHGVKRKRGRLIEEMGV